MGTAVIKILPVHFQANIATEALVFAAAKVMFVANISINITLLGNRDLHTHTQFTPCAIGFLLHAVPTNAYMIWLDEVMPDITNGVDGCALTRFASSLVR